MVMVKLIFSDGMQGTHSEGMGYFAGWRAAASAARRKLEPYGTVKREHIMPGGTDRLWVAPGNRAVHAGIQ
jgi:hypothetical protein